MSGSTVGQILGQLRPSQPTPRFLWGVVQSVSGTHAVVEMSPGGGAATCEIPVGLTIAAGNRVLLLIAPIGNVILAHMKALG